MKEVAQKPPISDIPLKWTEVFPCQCFKLFYLFMLIIELHPVDGITERLHAAKTLILVFILHFFYLDVFKVHFCIILYLSYFFMFASFQCYWSIKSVCFIKSIVYLILICVQLHLRKQNYYFTPFISYNSYLITQCWYEKIAEKINVFPVADNLKNISNEKLE